MNMNLVTVIVLFILGINLYIGYHDGFVRVIYSLISWLIIMAAVTWLTPYITSYIENETGIQTYISSRLETYFRESVEKKAKDVIGQSENGEHADISDQNSSDKNYSSFADGLSDLGIQLPEDITDSILKTLGNSATQMIEESQIYENLALGISHFIIQGAAFFIALMLGRIVVYYIERALKLATRLPVLHSMNKILGLTVGGIKGLLLIWLLFYLVAIFCTSALGAAAVEEIKSSELLTFLYKNNLLLKLVLMFL